jgi:hypothetical protein
MTDEADKAKRVRQSVTVALLAALMLLSALALLAGCMSTSHKTSSRTGSTTSYLHFNDDSVTRVVWEQAGQKLEGHIEVLERKPDGKVETTALNFNGELNGEIVSLTLDFATTQGGVQRLDKTITGELRGDTLTLPRVNGADGAEPVVFRRVGLKEFAEAVESLKKRTTTTKTSK